jgi:AraC family transcriptional regulator of arabinose operon
MPEAFVRLLGSAPTRVPISETFERMFAAAVMIARPASANANLVLEHLAVSLFAEYLRLAEDSAKSVKHSTPINKALVYIEHHFGEQECMINMLKASGASKSALQERFKREVGMPPARYLWQFRIERALGMLINTGLSIAEIAAHCGFQSQFHLSRLIKQRQGVSPREFRKQNWAGRQVSQS